MRVLFVRPYTHPPGIEAARASDALGFGITCADALLAGLRGRGVDVRTLPVPECESSTSWLARALEAFERAVVSAGCDVILAFHAFWPFAADLRRILDDNGSDCPLIAFTHGSHWDPTDLYRFERYPALRWADLGNLLAADRVLTVSRYMSDTLVRTLRAASDDAARELQAKLRVVGLPIDVHRIDAARRPKATTPTVVFNHRMTAAKQPAVFLAIAGELMRRTPARVLITRHVPPGSLWSRTVSELLAGHPGRLFLGDDMAIDEYFGALWASHIQVSTATHESLGVATLEAMATGNHCLLPRIGVYPDLAEADAEILYEPSDLSARLLRLVELDDFPTPAALRHAASVRERYAPERIAAAVHAVLLEAVDG